LASAVAAFMPDVEVDEALSLLQMRASSHHNESLQIEGLETVEQPVDKYPDVVPIGWEPSQSYAGLVCPPGQIKTFFETSGAQAMCADSGGYRLRDISVCLGAGTTVDMLGYKFLGWAHIPCPSTNGAWPTDGCFINPGTGPKRILYSKCARDGSRNAGNTFDSQKSNNWGPHNGICFKCSDDPNYVATTEPPATPAPATTLAMMPETPTDDSSAVSDDAAAVGDPHILSSEGKRFGVQ